LNDLSFARCSNWDIWWALVIHFHSMGDCSTLTCLNRLQFGSQIVHSLPLQIPLLPL
jgi:hypothetical protein